MITTTLPAEVEDTDAPPFGELLLKAAATPRQKAAVWALVEEEQILARPTFQRALLWQTDEGTEFSWQRLSCNLYGLGLDEAERAFVDLVLSIASSHQTHLMRVVDLGERRLAIVLRALTMLAGSNIIAIGTCL